MIMTVSRERAVELLIPLVGVAAAVGQGPDVHAVVGAASSRSSSACACAFGTQSMTGLS